MSDSYQATYDATRSRISNGDVGRAVHEAVSANISGAGHAIALLQEQVGIVGNEMMRPSVLYRPAISIDGNQWCALYGDNLRDGVAGFGDTPADAMRAFDEAWNNDNARIAAADRKALAAAHGQFGVGA
jgi:hypothetical protein